MKEVRFSVLDNATICHRKYSKNKRKRNQNHFKIVRLHFEFSDVDTNVPCV